MTSEITSDSEEEVFIFAELEENLKVDSFRSIHVLGIETKNPVIQLDDTFLTGKYEMPVGTHMFFEPDYEAKSEDPLFEKLPEQNLKYVCKSNKYLNLKCVQVTPKGNVSNEGTQVKDEKLEAANFSSIQEAVEKFKNEWKPSQSALQINS